MTPPPVVPEGKRGGEPRPLGDSLAALTKRLADRGLGGDVDWDAVEAEVRAAEEAEHRESRRGAWLRLIPEDVTSATVDTIDPVIRGEVIGWLDRTPRPNLVIAGPVGVGKTWVAYAAGAALVDRGEYVFATTTAALLRAIRPEGDREVEGRARAASYVILDDLGTEPMTEWAVAQLTDVLDERFREHRPVITTTNATYNDLAARLGDRIMSRLTGRAVIVQMDGPDRRRQTW